MDTNRLKRFATEARNKIRQGVVNKLLTLGFNAAGEADEFPRQLQGSTLFRGQQLEETFYDQWIALYEAIQKQGLKEVYEEVAYTWFNRFVAIRILQMNGFIDRVLVFDNPDIRVPHIVTEARQGRFPILTTSEQLRLRNIITDPTKTYEQFVILITAFCHTTPILNQCFGSINDYTELLLPNDVLEEGGFVDMLNHTEFISEEDYKTTELLGWLYQFYISERKDEVFASFKKGKKAEADDIAPATQIFTPNWIVKYMVENTLGRIYLDNNPGSDLQEQMPYLVEKAEGNEEAIYHYDQLEDLRVIDPACGSGHILLEAFDLLYTMYLDEFYSREEAISAIFEHNLVGIDLDTRARQLATFALLLKACQRDDRFLDAHCLPRVLDMTHLLPSYYANLRERLPEFLQTENKVVLDEVMEAYELMEQADSLGSIMRFAISEKTRQLLVDALAHWKETDNAEMQELFPSVRLILALTEKYAAVVANPPYMGSGKMNRNLNEYVKSQYIEGKDDLFSVFMIIAEALLQKCGKYGMINQDSWLFKSSFKKLRLSVLDNTIIDSLLHLGPRTFIELSGEVVQNVSFICTKQKPNIYTKGNYIRLVELSNCNEKKDAFLQSICNHSKNIYFPNILQTAFKSIPGYKIGYWLNNSIIDCFNHDKIGKVLTTREGMAPADEARFWRIWHEISRNDFSMFNTESDKWYPYIKGGSYRKWYGNYEYVVEWANDGYNIKNNKDINTGRIRSHNYNGEFAFKESLSWTVMYFGKISIRYTPNGFLWDSAGASGFSESNLFHSIGLLNSIVGSTFIRVLSDARKMNVGEVSLVPFIDKNNQEIDRIVKSSISISRTDWDAHETSWDFQRNELLTIDAETYADNIQYQIEKHEKETGEHLCIDPAAPELGSLAWRMEQYKLKWEKLFMQLHANEEELNRQFIDIYGLQDELTPDVPLDEVTILQQGEISIE